MNKLFLFFFLTFITVDSAFAQNNIRSVDFQNFTYQADFCGGESAKDITVVAGKFESEIKNDEYSNRIFFSIYGTEYGDLDGDENDEAVILSMCNTGGTGNFTEAYIYKMIGEKPTRIMLLSGGDRADGGLRKAWIENKLLVVESSAAGEFGGACCPEYIVTNKYRYKSKKLEEVSEDRREIYPRERIKFDKGTSSTTFTLKMSADEEIKRFVVGARNGQTLIVTKTSTEADVSLRQGDAEVLEEDDSLVAKLNVDGDYLIELRNFTEKDLEFSVTVTIK